MRRRPRRRLLRTSVLLALACSASLGAAQALSLAAERAGDVELVEVRVPASSARSRSASSTIVRLPIRADLLGASWRGSDAELQLRARTRGGSWSRWVDLHAGEDGPDPGSSEARTATRRVGVRHVASSPVFVGAADEVQVRGGRDVRVWAINATGTATRAERAATRLREDAAWVLGEPSAHAQPLAPGIRSRTLWKAAKPAASPWYADNVRGVVIHHTAETNRYSCSQVPALLRAIQRYHMRANGWNDIGYNFLVDRCGGVWEGRGGGLTKPVGGAHTAGFNTGTVGIALMGTHASVAPTFAARNALRRLVAWRLDVAHVKPTGKMILTAASSDKFPAGSRVVVNAVSGHRDLFPTSCPGAYQHRQLTRLARDAWITGGAKLANVTTTVRRRAPGSTTDASIGAVSVRAIASHADMYATIRLERRSTGELLHQAAIRGTLLRTTWTAPDWLQVPTWDTRIVINGARRSNRQRARAVQLPLEVVPDDPGFTVTTPPPASIAVGGDPVDDVIGLQYVLGLDYRLGAWLVDPATGAEVATLRNPAYVGPTQTPTDLALAIPGTVASGSYELRVGLPADPAVGRSMRSYPLVVTRS